MSNLTRSPIASIRREQTNIDPLDTGVQPTTHSNLSLKTPLPSDSNEVRKIYRSLTAVEQLEIDTSVFLGNCKMVPINSAEVPNTFEGLQTFARSCSWQSVVKLSTKLLFEEENASEDVLSSITAIRFEGLFRMKLYDDLTIEVTDLLSAEDKRLSIGTSQMNYNLTISMKLLLIDVKLMTGRNQEAIEQLLSMHLWLSTYKTPFAETNLSLLFWFWQVKSHIVNAYIRLRNWREASLFLKKMMKEIEPYYHVNDNIVDTTLDNHKDHSYLNISKIILLTKTTRLFLQVGSTKKAAEQYNYASELFASDTSVISKINSSLQSQLLLTQGLLLFATEQFEQALDIFTTVIDTEIIEQQQQQQLNIYNDNCKKQNFIFLTPCQAIACALSFFTTSFHQLNNNNSSSSSSIFSYCSDSSNNLIAAAVNNYAICCLYMKQIRMAIQRLEQLILSNPAKYLTDPIVFNLCTLYDLSYAPDGSNSKKKILQRVAHIFHIDDPVLHWRSFRLN